MKITFVLLPVLAILGCAANHYQPYSRKGYGYSEVNITKNKYEIMFHGGPDQDEMGSTQYAIIRAAEIGKRDGFGHFKILNIKENENARRIVTVDRESNYGRRGGAPPHRGGYWGPGYTARITTHVDRRIGVKLVVQYQNEDCEECLSVEGKLQEAVTLKIIK